VVLNYPKKEVYIGFLRRNDKIVSGVCRDRPGLPRRLVPVFGEKVGLAFSRAAFSGYKNAGSGFTSVCDGCNATSRSLGNHDRAVSLLGGPGAITPATTTCAQVVCA
jgi:hypothetical protein